MPETSDPEARALAASRLNDLFQGLGRQAQGDTGGLGDLGGLIGQFEEFASVPLDLAMLFLNMSVELTELVLRTLEEGGVILMKGLTPV